MDAYRTLADLKALHEGMNKDLEDRKGPQNAKNSCYACRRYFEAGGRGLEKEGGVALREEMAGLEKRRAQDCWTAEDVAVNTAHFASAVGSCLMRLAGMQALSGEDSIASHRRRTYPGLV